MAMAVETEVKIPLERGELAALRGKLESLGARCLCERALEENILLDYADRRLKTEGCALRLRSYGSGSLLTYKGKVIDDPHFKKRPEYQTSLSNPEAALAILSALGLDTSFHYSKIREILEWSLSGIRLEISLDETPFGDFLEIEGEPETILEAVARLGMSADRFVRRSYVEMYEEATQSE